jgi:hypothetical protein
MPKVTDEQAGLAILDAIQKHGVELDPINRPGLFGVEDRSYLRSLIPANLRHRFYRGCKWAERHAELGMLITEHRGNQPGWYFIITDPAHIAECRRAMQFNAKTITSRLNRQNVRVMNVANMVGNPQVVSALTTTWAEEQAAHRMGVRTLAGVLGVPAEEAEQVWLSLGQTTNNNQPVPTP